MTTDLPSFDHEALRAALDVDRAARQREMLDRWVWSQVIAPSPLPVCIVTGI